jgi:hypothetical protein
MGDWEVGGGDERVRGVTIGDKRAAGYALLGVDRYGIASAHVRHAAALGVIEEEIVGGW